MGRCSCEVDNSKGKIKANHWSSLTTGCVLPFQLILALDAFLVGACLVVFRLMHRKGGMDFEYARVLIAGPNKAYIYPGTRSAMILRAYQDSPYWRITIHDTASATSISVTAHYYRFQLEGSEPLGMIGPQSEWTARKPAKLWSHMYLSTVTML